MAKADRPTGKDGFNWSMDLISAATVIAEWPTDLVVSSIGSDVLTGARLMAALPSDHPVHIAYRTFLGSPDANRPSWDQLAALYAAWGSSTLFVEHWDSGLRLDVNSGENEWGAGECAGRRGCTSALVSSLALAQCVEDLMIESAASR
jgi:hypothetical protein